MESPRMEGSKEDDSFIVTAFFISVASISIEDTVKSQGMEGSKVDDSIIVTVKFI
jgi:hypothetical protein